MHEDARNIVRFLLLILLHCYASAAPSPKTPSWTTPPPSSSRSSNALLVTSSSGNNFTIPALEKRYITVRFSPPQPIFRPPAYALLDEFRRQRKNTLYLPHWEPYSGFDYKEGPLRFLLTILSSPGPHQGLVPPLTNGEAVSVLRAIIRHIEDEEERSEARGFGARVMLFGWVVRNGAVRLGSGRIEYVSVEGK